MDTNDVLIQFQNRCLKKELFLVINDYGEVDSCKDLIALARLVQRIFLMHKHTYPDDPDMGIGISNYEFEFLDNTTLDELKESAKQQINKYVTSTYISDIIIDTLENKQTGQMNTIGVLVNLTKKVNGNSNFVLTFEKAEKTGKIISKILI